MSVLVGVTVFAERLLGMTRLNNAMLETALRKLQHFPKLSIEDRISVCHNLIRNGEVNQLIRRVRFCPDSIPMEAAEAVYRAAWKDDFYPDSYAFLEREQQRLTRELGKEAWVYSRKSMRESEELALVRLAKLLRIFGRDGEEVSFRLAQSAYERYRWLPEDLKHHMPRILLELPHGEFTSNKAAKIRYFGKHFGKNRNVSKRMAFAS